MNRKTAPLFSVFTPSHDARFLDECLESLQAQTNTRWEWIVLLNNGARWRPENPDPRIQIYIDDEISGIGALKALACSHAKGKYLVELDHDDLLTPDALECIEKAFKKTPKASLVYSYTAHITSSGGRDDSRFSAAAGWVYEETKIGDRELIYAISMEPTPHNVSYIWFAPNHVRAFPRRVYEKVGGYDVTRGVLDDQDLMCRLYLEGEFHRIEKCLYLQRFHQGNTQHDSETNAFIQKETVALYDQRFERNALAWSKRNGLLSLDLGAAHNRPDGYMGVDQYPGEKVDIVATLPGPLDLPDNSVGVIRAVDFLEHVVDKIALINEIYRLLAPGGILISQTPSTDGRGAFQDPTHVAYYNEHSFWYYTDANYRRFVPEIEAKFQVSRLQTVFPTEWHAAHNISYVTANLIALKPGVPRNGGPLNI
ncbi:glycosyltransferase [Lysinibacter sp. HNR]|uniref:glycosyltransferase n=1 Tax=Lysinibacter sp. HNR TaxID=3031408 RepID=UPI0024347DDA|nr:glycosyltransferase [Lysinibacter sp. HNR]WGD38229.1 glycosyltransferase [Lysinibacter sp. HNR]